MNISKYNKGNTKKVIMKNGVELEVSRTKLNELVDKLNEFFPELF